MIINSKTIGQPSSSPGFGRWPYPAVPEKAVRKQKTTEKENTEGVEEDFKDTFEEEDQDTSLYRTENSDFFQNVIY